MTRKLKPILCLVVVAVLATSVSAAVSNAVSEAVSAEGDKAGISLSDRLRSHIFTLADSTMHGRMAGSPEMAKAREYIERQFAEIGLESIMDGGYFQNFRAKTRIFEGDCSNIMGVIRGCDSLLKDQYVVFSAHYDGQGTVKGDDGVERICPGAYDNASGVATLIEAARMLSRNETGLKRSVIVVAFDAEERGLDGSFYFVRNPPVLIEDVVLAVNIDQIGLFPALNYTGVATLDKGREIVMSAPGQGQLKVGVRELDENPKLISDEYPFALVRKPTLFVSSGPSPLKIYHNPGDVPENINIRTVENAAKHLASVVERLADAPQLTPSGVYTPRKNSALEAKLTNEIYRQLK